MNTHTTLPGLTRDQERTAELEEQLAWLASLTTDGLTDPSVATRISRAALATWMHGQGWTRITDQLWTFANGDGTESLHVGPGPEHAPGYPTEVLATVNKLARSYDMTWQQIVLDLITYTPDEPTPAR